MDQILDEIRAERARQDAKWGVQNHPDGTGKKHERAARLYRGRCDYHTEKGSLTWLNILLEEVFEAFAESNKTRLRAELIQVAAVVVAWIEKLDREAQCLPSL